MIHSAFSKLDVINNHLPLNSLHFSWEFQGNFWLQKVKKSRKSAQFLTLFFFEMSWSAETFLKMFSHVNTSQKVKLHWVGRCGKTKMNFAQQSASKSRNLSKSIGISTFLMASFCCCKACQTVITPFGHAIKGSDKWWGELLRPNYDCFRP